MNTEEREGNNEESACYDYRYLRFLRARLKPNVQKLFWYFKTEDIEDCEATAKKINIAPIIATFTDSKL